jgi:hypothetical protein
MMVDEVHFGDRSIRPTEPQLIESGKALVLSVKENDNCYVDYFEDVVSEMSEIHKKKNADYGNNFHKRYAKYGFLTALLRLTDKMERLENIYEKGEIQVKDESVEDTLIDLANYAVMTVVELRNEKEGRC